MNEIEKLYENAGIEKDWNPTPYGGIEEYYPPFTAEKQLEITKFIGLRYGIKFIINEAIDYMLSTDLYYKNKFDKRGYGYGFDEAIANLTNNLWQNLTKKEKQQVKGILEWV